MALLLLVAWIYNLISKSFQKREPDPYYCCDDSTMSSDSPRTESAASGSSISSAWRTPDRNNNSDSSMEELENALGAINLLVSSPTTLSPFDFRNTRTPEEMALFDRFGDNYQDVVSAMDPEEQLDLKSAIRFEVPNHPTVSGLHKTNISTG